MTVWTIVGGIAAAYGLYVVGCLVVGILLVPWFINAFNGFGYWHNAFTLIGLKDFVSWVEEHKYLRSKDPCTRRHGELLRSLRLQRQYIKKHGHNDPELITRRRR